MSTARLFRDAWERWLEDGAFQVSATLAYYAIFAMAPLLIILTFLVGLVYQGDALEWVRSEIARLAGPDAADLIAAAVTETSKELVSGVVYTTLAIFVMLMCVSALSNQLRMAMNIVLNVPPRTGESLLRMMKTRFSTLPIVFAAGVLLQLSVVVSWAISAYHRYLQTVLPNIEFVWQWIDLGISFAVVTTLFAMIYKWLPDAKLAWRDVWTAAVVTALLFSAGKYAIAFYLAHSSFQTIYGAAGSLMVLLAWVYYSSAILLFGAEFLQVFSEGRGNRVMPHAKAS